MRILELIAPYVSAIAVILFLALTERMRRIFATKDEYNGLRQRVDEQALALQHNADSKVAELQRTIDSRVAEIAQDVHNVMGKVEIIRDTIHAREIAQVQEMAQLRMQIESSLSKFEGILKGMLRDGWERK